MGSQLDTDPRPRAPLAVRALIASNALVFGYELVLSGARSGDASALGEFIATWGLVPREFLRELADPGATRQVAWLTPISSMFVHASALHLASNLLYLWVLGDEIERWLGARRFLLLYFACGLAASALQIASDPSSYVATVGASGAISGLLGAYVASVPQRRLRLRWPRVSIPALAFLLAWVVIQVLSGIEYRTAEEGGPAWWAHTGGFAAGFALARWLRARGRAADLRTPSRS